MKNFFWILTHYLKKNFLDLANYLLIALPLFFVFIYESLDNAFGMLDALFVAAIVLGMQFFAADTATGWLHKDLKGPTGSRLRVSGVSQHIFYLAVIIAGSLFHILLSGILVAITSLVPFFNADWGNYVFAMITITLIVFLIQLIGVLIFYFTKDEKAGSRISYLFGEVMIATAFVPVLSINLPNIIDTIFDFFPVGLGLRAISAGSLVNALPYFGILFGMNVALALVVLFVGRRKRNDSL